MRWRVRAKRLNRSTVVVQPDPLLAIACVPMFLSSAAERVSDVLGLVRPLCGHCLFKTRSSDRAPGAVRVSQSSLSNVHSHHTCTNTRTHPFDVFEFRTFSHRSATAHARGGLTPEPLPPSPSAHAAAPHRRRPPPPSPNLIVSSRPSAAGCCASCRTAAD